MRQGAAKTKFSAKNEKIMVSHVSWQKSGYIKQNSLFPISQVVSGIVDSTTHYVKKNGCTGFTFDRRQPIHDHTS